MAQTAGWITAIVGLLVLVAPWVGLGVATLAWVETVLGLIALITGISVIAA